ncbi:MAG: pyridoxal phosphate-dependent aminotransferase [Vulcanisaeta sp. AZ3]
MNEDMNTRGHGGFGWKHGLIDLSSNINPLGPPGELMELIKEATEQAQYTHYPTELGNDLREGLAKYEGVDSSLTYVFNGATEALQLLIMYLRPRRIVMPIPNYSDYGRIAKLMNIELTTLEYWGSGDLVEKIHNKLVRGAMVIISNSNSPMGYLIQRNELLEMAEELVRYDGLLLVDESFMDFVKDEQSLIKDIDQHENIIVVKSYTKFLAIPGLRVGAAYSKIDIEDLVPTWPINSIAEYAVSKYMKHAAEFRKNTITFINTERNKVLRTLEDLGINYYPSVTHYFVIKHEPWLNDELMKRGFLIRELSNIPPLTKGYFRFSLRESNINDAFLNALRETTLIKK